MGSKLKISTLTKFNEMNHKINLYMAQKGAKALIGLIKANCTTISHCDPIFVFDNYIVHTQSSMYIEKPGRTYTRILKLSMVNTISNGSQFLFYSGIFAFIKREG